MDYGRSLLSKVVAEGTLKTVTELGIHADHFVAKTDRDVYETITDHHQRYGKVPSVTVLKMDFPDYRFIKVEEPIEFLADKVRNAYRGAMLEQLLTASVEYYDDGQFEEALQFLNDGVRSLRAESGDRLRALDVGAMLEKWAEYRKNPPVGVPYGLKELDEATRGMHSDDFVVLAGPPGSGKSALLLNMALTAKAKGRKALFITIEMSDEHHMYRVAANLTGIPYQKIKFGEDANGQKLTDREAARVDGVLKAVAEEGLLVMQEIEPARATLETVEALIAQHRPDALYLDGAYLMELPGVRTNAAQWERLSALTREMRAMVLRNKIPIAISTQVLTSKMQGGEVTAGSVGYSSSFHQDASALIGIQPDPELPDRQIVKALKLRDAHRPTIFVKWNWETYTCTTVQESEGNF